VRRYLPTDTPVPVVVVLSPPSIGDDCPKPSKEDNLLTPDIRLHIVINVVSRLNAVEEFRSLSGEELSLREFLLDQIILLRESLEPCLVPRVIEELLGTKMVTPPQLRTLLVLQPGWQGDRGRVGRSPRRHSLSSGYGGQGGGGVFSGHLRPSPFIKECLSGGS
jgi:hypothetical protein